MAAETLLGWIKPNKLRDIWSKLSGKHSAAQIDRETEGERVEDYGKHGMRLVMRKNG